MDFLPMCRVVFLSSKKTSALRICENGKTILSCILMIIFEQFKSIFFRQKDRPFIRIYFKAEKTRTNKSPAH